MKLVINKIEAGERIFKIRTKMNLTLEEFGKIFNAGKSNVQKWEIGSSLPNKKRLGLISKVGKVSYNELLYGSFSEFLINNLEQGFDLISPKINVYAPKSVLLSLKKHIKLHEKEINSSVDFKNLTQEQLVDDLIKYLKNELSLYYKSNIEMCKYFLDNYELTTTYFKIVAEEMHYTKDLNTFLEKLSSEKKDKVLYYYNISAKLNNYIAVSEYQGYAEIPKKVYTTNYSLFLEVLLMYSVSFFAAVDIEVERFATSTIYAKTNKYGLNNYNFLISMYIKEEDTIYYLAHFKDTEEIPINEEAEYFIINNDLSYSIKKIKERPTCKYFAPIIGRME